MLKVIRRPLLVNFTRSSPVGRRIEDALRGRATARPPLLLVFLGGGTLEGFLGNPGGLWGCFGSHWGCSGSSPGGFGGSRRRLGRSSRRLVGSWTRFGGSWGRFEGVLGVLERLGGVLHLTLPSPYTLSGLAWPSPVLGCPIPRSPVFIT